MSFSDSVRSLWCPFLLIAAILVGGTPAPLHAQDTYTVNSSDDQGDTNRGDGDCKTGDTLSGGTPECTLRAALEESNADGDDDTIQFSIPNSGTATITATAEFQAKNPVTIDGQTAPTYPRSSTGDGPVIQLQGRNLSADVKDGIQVQASDVKISGIAVNKFPGYGINVLNSGTSVTIVECFVGLNFIDGLSDEGNGKGGIRLDGDDFEVQKNIISQNDGEGVKIRASSASGIAILQDNLIGTDVNGDDAAGNDGPGVRLVGGSGTEVGFFEPNYISGNGGAGVVVESAGHDVSANLIGTDSSGTSEVPNRGPGIRALANADISNNTISGNDGNGITVGNSSNSVDNVTIDFNTIGLSKDGEAVLANGDGTASGGIACIRSENGTIPGSDPRSEVNGNVIAGNKGEGIRIPKGCQGWSVWDNYVGTNRDFDSGLGNTVDGIQVRTDTATGYQGLAVIVDENVIVSSGEEGVVLGGNNADLGANYVGVSPTGKKLGNGSHGVLVTDSIFTIGGGGQVGDDSLAGHPLPGGGDGSVIGANGGAGILIKGKISDFEVEKSYIGTNPSGADLGNSGDGIRIVGNGSTSSNHEIGYGVNDPISDPDPANGGSGNVIAFNGGDAISAGKSESADNVYNVTVRGNATFQNGGNEPQLGFDLGNSSTTLNDAKDLDSGPNHLQNFPKITNVLYNNSTNSVRISYRVKGTPESDANGNRYPAYPLRIDFYAADSKAGGEGKIWLDSQKYEKTDAGFEVDNVIDLSQYSNVTKNDHLVATATDSEGNTSEFTASSAALPVELASFDATQTGDTSIELTWTTASETNNAGFRIQHMGPVSTSWEKVGFVEGRGTTSQSQSYRFEAGDLAVGTHQFRLKQVDLDGTTEVHDPVTVDLQMQEALRLRAPAPNPVRERATLSFAVREAREVSITLYNTLGQRVRTVYRGRPAAGKAQTAEVDAGSLSSGVYFLRLQAGERTETRRLTVVR